MEKFHILKEIRHATHSIVWHLVLQGILLLILGVLVIFYPQILILLFAFFFIFAGLVALSAAVKIKKIVKHIDHFFDLF